MDKIYCFGFLLFSKSIIRRFFSDERAELVFVHSAKAAIRKGFDRHNCAIAAWGKRGESQAKFLSRRFDVPVWQVEDGFVRSVGLGSDYTPPASLVIDKTGIYYDPRIPSDLEIILQSHDFDESLLDRAKQIQQLLVEQAISKYNVGRALDARFIEQSGRRTVILIPGQVEDDASILKGCVDIKCNAELIREVRRLNPTAFIIYKPHPDVVSGNRRGGVASQITAACCDAVLEDVSITDCLAWADEVHTLTSLVGLEALMRGCKVVCYGLPFYAGWGLTTDKHALSRRTRRVGLYELIAATYILYPRYIDWERKVESTPEYIIQQLSYRIQCDGGKAANRVSRLQRQLRKAGNMLKSAWQK